MITITTKSIKITAKSPMIVTKYGIQSVKDHVWIKGNFY